MSMHSYAVNDKGLAVKIEEIDIEKFRDVIKKHKGQDLYHDNNTTLRDALRDFLVEDAQWYIGDKWADGVICHKWSYGKDIYGDFIPLLDEVKQINIDVENDDWVLMCLPRYASLFEQAYLSGEALISEMKQLYGKFLPEDFNYRERLAFLCAVVWG